MDYVQNIGIFVPKRHAAWEDSSIENRSLLGVQGSCVAPKCYSRRGREFSVDESNAKLEFMNCEMCGGTAVHRICLDRERLEPARKYQCNSCEMASNETRTKVIEVSDDEDSELSMDGLLDKLSMPKLAVPKPIPPPPKKYY